jgi:hypothetical protein
MWTWVLLSRSQEKNSATLTIDVDLFLPFLSACRREEVYDDLILCDVRALPFSRRSFDSVLCTEVIEHLEKGDGIDLIHQLEAERNVVISTPVGFLRECREYGRERILRDASEYRKQQKAYRSPHISGWSPESSEGEGIELSAQVNIDSLG